MQAYDHTDGFRRTTLKCGVLADAERGQHRKPDASLNVTFYFAESIRNMDTFATGLPGLDRKIGHFAEENLITIAGARSDEASILVVNMLRHIVFELGGRALVLLPGQRPATFEQRLRGAATGVPHDAVEHDRLTAPQRRALELYAKRRADAYLDVVAPRSVRLEDLDDVLEPYGRQHLIVVDSVQMLEFAGPVQDEWGETLYTESRIDQLSRASRSLKHLAIRNKATVIAVCRRVSRYTPDAEKRRALAEHSQLAFEAFLRDSDIVLELYPKPNTGPQDTRRLVYIRKNRWAKDKMWVPLGLEYSTSMVTDEGTLGRRGQ